MRDYPRNLRSQPLAILRLKNRGDFLRVAGTKISWVTPAFVLQIAPQPQDIESSGFRVGFTASRKVGNSVARNRAKRRLREIVEKTFPQLAKPGCDYVVIARNKSLTLPFETILQDMEKALKHIHQAKPRDEAKP